MRRLVYCLLVGGLLAAGCFDDRVVTLDVLPPTPGAAVVGRVLDTTNRSAVPEARISLLPAGSAVVADTLGFFALPGLQPGANFVRVEADHHVPTTTTIVFDPATATTGTLQVHCDLPLPPRSVTLPVRCVMQETGRPVTDVVLRVVGARLPDGWDDCEVDPLEVMAPIAVGEDGFVTITDLPPLALTIRAEPDPASGLLPDDVAVALSRPGTVPVAITLEHGVDVLFVASNLPASNGTLTADSLQMRLAEPLPDWADSLTVTVTRAGGAGTAIPLDVAWRDDVTFVARPTIPFDPQPVFLVITLHTLGQQYELFRRLFEWRIDSGEEGCVEEVADFGRMGVSPPDFDTDQFTLHWQPVSCGGSYLVYARGSRQPQDWVLVWNEPTDYDFGQIVAQVTLPEAFDVYADALFTPFAGQTVTFCVVPALAAAPMPGPPHPVLELRDETPPSVVDVTQVGDPGLTPGNEPYSIRLSFSEYLADWTPPLTVTVREAGGDPDYHLDPDQLVWEWDVGRLSGGFVLTSPVTGNIGEDELRIQGHIQDLSGNEADIDTGWLTIHHLFRLYTFEESAEGWWAETTQWEWGHPVSGPNGGHDSDRCWGTNLAGPYAPNWDTCLISPPLFVPSVRPQLRFWSWYRLADDHVTIYAEAGGEDVFVAYLAGNNPEWGERIQDMSRFAGQYVRLKFRLVSNNANEDAGFYLDDVQLLTRPPE